jgi:ferredoxin
MKKNAAKAKYLPQNLLTLQRIKHYLHLIYISIMAYVIGNDCVACGTCIDECPVGAISEGEIYHINPDECTECGTCASVCPNEAISLAE